MSVPLFPYFKFTKCCDGTVIYFTGSLSITSGESYRYSGVSPFVGSGGTLEPDYCYFIESLISQTAVLYPTAPSNAAIEAVDSCANVKCAPCSTSTCECPEGYVEIDGECVETVIIDATYSGELLEVERGNTNNGYTAYGVRLYTDISSATFPILGTGTNNSNYTVKANNGAGAVIAQIGSDVQSNLWGSWAPCATGSTGGRLNTVGIWADNYPDDTELCFEYCVEPTATKQYLVGMAGDNAVRFYVDGTLIVNLDTPSGSTATVPFTRWHVFPITLTAGQHTIKICGYNNEGSAAFGAEIYDINVATFQGTLLNPSVSPPNCGNVPADLEPYILFSTQNMIGLSVPDPDNPGEWTCPEGYTLDECLGVPVCTIETRFDLVCPCYLLVPCDGTTAPFISNTNGLENYINEFVSVSYGDFSGCVYVVEQEDSSCENAVDVNIDADVTCDCDTICYYIEGADGISYVQYVDESDQLLQIAPTATQPWLTLCSKVLPIVGNTTDNYTITVLGDCIDNECQQKCFKLIDCEDEENILYSTSFVLLPHALNGDIIKIAGYTECWLVEITEDDCDCAIDVSITFNSRTCEECREIIAYKLTSCNGLYNTQYTYDDLSQYVDQTLLTDCGCFIVELINYAPPSIQTIVIITAFEDCIACERPYYRLTECNTDETIDTYSDLSQYLDQVVNLANCDGCYTVESIIIPNNPSIVTVTDSHIDCITCATTAPCVCSNVRNDNAVAYTYDYIDCYGDTQSVTVQPGETSPKICLIKWLEPEGCDCLIRTVTTGSSVTNTVLNASGTLINFKNSWELSGSLYIYYNGTQWIMNNSSENPQYYLLPSKSDCPSGTWKPFSSIPQQTPTTITTVSCQSFYQVFGECNNGVCPAPIYPKRGIKPGYNTPACSAEKYEEISCKSSQILYRQVLELRYGISNCCPEQDEYWLVKKELIDLAALYNPDYVCAPANSCGCGQPNNCGCNSCNS
jgi:hypothetical protein